MPFQFEPYDNSRSAGSIAEIMQRAGHLQAAQVASQGEARARTIATIGQGASAIAGSIGDIANQRKAQRVDEAKQAAIAKALHGGINEDGTYDRTKVQAGLEQSGLGSLWPALSEHLDKQDAATLDLQKKRQDLQPKTPPVKTRQVVTTNPDGSTTTRIVEDTPGAEFHGAPPVVKPPAPPNLGSFEDYTQRYAKDKGVAPEALTTTQIEDARKRFNQADDRPRVDVHMPGAEGMTPDAVDYVATQYRILGPSGMPTRIDANERVKILNAAAKQVKSLGQSPAVAVQRQAAFKADASSLTKMSTMKSAAEAFETKANAQAGLVADLSKKVGRTQFPIVNSALLSGKESLAGDENTHLFSNALLTFTSEYAKIMEGSTGSAAGSSEGARRDAAKLISTALNNGTVQKTLAQMQWEMRQTIQGYDVTIQHITDRMGGAPPAPAPAAIAAPAAPVAPMKIGKYTVTVKP